MSHEDGDRFKKQRKIMSKSYDKSAYLAFKNRSEGRRAAVYWLNYNGEKVRYIVLDFNQAYPVNTFETHPWVFADADTGDELLGNGHKIYMPKAWNGEGYRTQVCIGLPVYSLKERCFQVVRKITKNTDIPKEELPCTLWKEIDTVKNTPFLLYNRGQNQQQIVGNQLAHAQHVEHDVGDVDPQHDQ